MTGLQSLLGSSDAGDPVKAGPASRKHRENDDPSSPLSADSFNPDKLPVDHQHPISESHQDNATQKEGVDIEAEGETDDVETPDPDFTPSDTSQKPEFGHEVLTDILQGWTGISAALSSENESLHIAKEVPLESRGKEVQGKIEAPLLNLNQSNSIGDNFVMPRLEDQNSLTYDPETTLNFNQPSDGRPTLPEAIPPGKLSAQHTALVQQQVSNALVRMQGSQLEISLSPEELGRVRLVLNEKNGVMHLLVWAERPEVLDLFRRNSALLHDHFSESGTELGSMEFNSDADNRGRGLLENPEVNSEKNFESTALSIQATPPHQPVDYNRIDIRL